MHFLISCLMLNTDLVRCSAVIFIWGQFYKKRLNQQLLELNGKLFFLKFHSNLSGVNELTHCVQMTHMCIGNLTIIDSDNREVSLHVKRERVHVTSHLGAQFRYTSCSRTLLGFASRRDVSTEKQGHGYQQMTGQQSIKCARKQKLMHSA